MMKRIQVVDDSGKQYEPTHPKRAKGLVKKGRARFIGGDTICLVAPPDHDFEEEPFMAELNPTVTIEYVLAQIEKLSAEPAYVREAIEKIDNSAPDKAPAIASVVEAREATNRSILDFYRQIYADLNPQAHAMTVLEKAAGTAGIPMGEVTNMLNRLLGLEGNKK